MQSCRWVGDEMVVSSAADGTTKWWRKEEVGTFTNVATFFSSQPTSALAVIQGMAVIGGQQGAMLFVDAGGIEAKSVGVQSVQRRQPQQV